MSTYCTVPGCHMNRKRAIKFGLEISFFHFPNNPSLRQLWVDNCKLPIGKNLKNVRVCSQHFVGDDFERDLQSELLQLKPRLILKRTSIPSQKLPGGPVNDNDKCISPLLVKVEDTQINWNDEPTIKIECDFIQDDLEALKTEDEALQKTEYNLNFIPNEIEEFKTEIEEQTAEYDSNLMQDEKVDNEELQKTECNLNCVQNEMEELKAKNKEMQKRIMLLKVDNSSLQTQLNRQKEFVGKHKNEVLAFRRKQRSKQRQKNDNNKINGEVNQKIKHTFNKVFTQTQLDRILTKKQVQWKDEDMRIASSIRQFSEGAYLFLRDHLQYPLPGLSTLHQWTTCVEMHNGILDSVFRFLEVAGKNFDEKDRNVVLTFGEIKDEKYDKINDEINSPNSYVQVVIARGLFKDWKQPIFADFDRKIDCILLTELILKLWRIGYKVVACVSDCSPSNVSLWKELELTPERPWFIHPEIEKNIYFFPDAPHLLQLLRNLLIDSDLSIDGHKVTNKPLRKLITNTENNNSIKINEEHLVCEEVHDRKSVALSTQLISHNTATALKQNFPNDDEPVKLSNFISIVNKWFDVMNSHTQEEKIPSKKAYGVNENIQNDILMKMYQTIDRMACEDKKALQLIQKGVSMSINSTINLFKDMQTDYNANFILMDKLNQDVLENVFSPLQSNDENGQPKHLNILQKIREMSSSDVLGLVLSKASHDSDKRSTTSAFKSMEVDAETCDKHPS